MRRASVRAPTTVTGSAAVGKPGHYGSVEQARIVAVADVAEAVTEPLWGVATTAPYGHDGRSANLREVILRHGGEAQQARDAFAALSDARQRQLLEFLGSLVLFPPPDTASNLDPADPTMPDYPQFGHGSIALGPLFNDPHDKE